MNCPRRTCADKVRGFIGKGAQGESRRAREPSRTALFHGDGSSFQLSLANHSDSESFLVVHALFSQDGCQRGFWEVVRHVVSPFDLSRTLPVGGGLLVPCSCLKTALANGYCRAWPGWVVSVSVLP